MIPKLLLIAASAVGFVGFFQPFVTGALPNGGALSLSSYDLITGAQAMKSGIDAASEGAPGQREDSVDPAIGADQADLELASAQMTRIAGLLLVPWIPTVLFTLFALIALSRFGRSLAVLTLLVGIGTIAGWLFLNMMFDRAMTANHMAPDIGFIMILVGGIIGVVAGAAGLVSPQQRKPAA